METLYATGIRHRELWRLEVYDVQLRARRSTVRGGKGGKDRIVPLTSNAAYWIERYLAEARGELSAGYVMKKAPLEHHPPQDRQGGRAEIEEHLEDGELPGGQPPAKPPLLDSEAGRLRLWRRVEPGRQLGDGGRPQLLGDSSDACAELVSVVDQDGDGRQRCIKSHCHLESLRSLT